MQNSILDLDQVSVSFDGFYALTDLDFTLVSYGLLLVLMEPGKPRF